RSEIGGADAQSPISGLQSPISSLQSLFLTLLICGLLSEPILLPAIELTRYSERSQFSYQESINFSLAPTQAIGVLTPRFFGHGPALHWGLWERVETPFAGVATLLLAVAGVLLSDGATRRRLWPWLAIALFGLVNALGVYGILHGWMTLLLPIFGELRAPARGLVLWTFALAVLSAVGFEAVRCSFHDLYSLLPGERQASRIEKAGAGWAG